MFLPVRWKQDETLKDLSGSKKRSRAETLPRGKLMEAALEQGDEEKKLCLAFFLLSERLQEPSSRLTSIGQVILPRKSEGPTAGIRSYIPASWQ